MLSSLSAFLGNTEFQISAQEIELKATAVPLGCTPLSALHTNFMSLKFVLGQFYTSISYILIIIFLLSPSYPYQLSFPTSPLPRFVIWGFVL